MNKTLEEMGFTDTAKDITSLDEAYQALTVSGGILLEKILVPITPLLMSIMEGVMGAVDTIVSIIDGLTSAWNSLPDWAKEAGNIGIFMGALVLLSVFILTTLIPTLSTSLMGALVSFGSMVGITIIPEMATLSGALLTVATAAWAAIAPFLPFIIAAGLLAVAIYEVGKAFGWWTDVGSMIDAIKNNIGRLWNAFINHPDVQGIIQWIGDAWKELNNSLKPVVDWLKGIWDEMFPESAKGKVDGTRAIIDAIGVAFQVLSTPIRTAIDILKFLWDVFSSVGSAIQSAQNKFGPFVGVLLAIVAPVLVVYEALKKIVCILLGCSPGIVPALQTVQEVFTTVWNAIVGFLSGVISNVLSALQPVIDILTLIGEFIVGQFMESWNAFVSIILVIWDSVNLLVTVFQSFMDGQISLTSMLSMVWNIISTMFATVFNIIIQRVISFGSSFVNGIISFISTLPGRIWNYLMLAYTRITTQLTLWVNKARTMALAFVVRIITQIATLPGKIYSYLIAVVARISGAISQWITAAVSKVQELISNVVSPFKDLPSKIASALSGVVDAITKPFRDAWSAVEPYVNKIKEGIDVLSQVTGFGGETAYGGEIAYGGETAFDKVESFEMINNIHNYDESNNEIDVNHTINLILDFINLPPNVDADSLIQAFKDKNVLRALVENKEFQDLDANVKKKINYKINRARGV